MAGPETPQQVQTGPEWVVSAYLTSQYSPNRIITGKNYPRQSRDRPDSSIVCSDSSRQDVGKSNPPKQTHTTPDRPDSATTRQYSAGIVGDWPESAERSGYSAIQGGDWPDRNAVGVSDVVNPCL